MIKAISSARHGAWITSAILLAACGSSGSTTDAGTDANTTTGNDTGVVTPRTDGAVVTPGQDGAVVTPGNEGGVVTPTTGFSSYAPSNVSLAGVDFTRAGDVHITSSVHLDGHDGTIVDGGSGTPITGFVFVPTTQTGAGSVAVFAMNSLLIDPGATLEIQGDKPVILLVAGTATVQGTITVDSNANGSLITGVGIGEDMSGTAAGGGGAFCALGGAGAGSTTHAMTYGTATLAPLVGGSRGGINGGGAGGSGGGALQLSAGTAVVIAPGGIVNAAGTGGGAGTNPAGGGSGGAILLEAPSVTISGIVAANGGGGGSLNDVGSDGDARADQAAGGGSTGGAGGANTVVAGVNGTAATDDLGGGGGSAGRIRINSTTGLAAITGTVSPGTTSQCATQGMLNH